MQAAGKDRMDCLIVIDPQMEFVSTEGAYANRGHGTSDIRGCLGRINEYLSRSELHRILIYSDYTPGQFEPGLNLCIPGSSGHKVALSLDNFDTVLAKTDHDAVESSDLRQALSEIQPERIQICGFLLEYCVRKTAISLRKDGWPVAILEDLISTGDDVLHRKSEFLREMEALGASLEKV